MPSASQQYPSSSQMFPSPHELSVQDAHLPLSHFPLAQSLPNLHPLVKNTLNGVVHVSQGAHVCVSESQRALPHSALS